MIKCNVIRYFRLRLLKEKLQNITKKKIESSNNLFAFAVILFNFVTLVLIYYLNESLPYSSYQNLFFKAKHKVI